MSLAITAHDGLRWLGSDRHSVFTRSFNFDVVAIGRFGELDADRRAACQFAKQVHIIDPRTGAHNLGREMD